MIKKKKFNAKTFKWIGHDKPYLFFITWLDHNHTYNGGWQDLKDVSASTVTVRSVGWVMHSSKDCIAVVSTLTESGQNLGSMNILKNDILSAKRLDDGKFWAGNFERGG